MRGYFRLFFVLGVLMLTSCSRERVSHFGRLSEPDATVWAMKRTGNYYCIDSVMFGRQPGVVMKQVQALDRGYQPALSSYCPESPAPSDASDASASVQ